MSETRRLITTCSILTVLAMVTAIGCIYSKHQSRKLFVELQALTNERDALEVDWGRLQIEQSTWSTHARVEKLARDKMRMRTPQANDVRLVRP